MKTQLFKVFAVSILGIATQSSVFALGSYMFCVNKNNSHDWKWAPPSSALQGFEDVVPGDNKGTWIYGLGMLNLSYHSVLEVAIKDRFDTSNDANEFCKALANICINAYGSDFSYIGASSHVIPSSAWGYITVPYGQPASIRKFWKLPYWRYSNRICPNWNYPEGDNG